MEIVTMCIIPTFSHIRIYAPQMHDGIGGR